MMTAVIVRASCLAGVLLMTLVGCGSGPTPPGAPSAAPGSSSSSGSPELPTDDPAGCSDGTCDLRVTGPVQIPLDPRFDITELRVRSVKDDSVSLVATFAPGSGTQVISTGGSCSTDMESGGDDEPARLKATCDTGTKLRLPTIAIELDSDRQGAVQLRISPR